MYLFAGSLTLNSINITGVSAKGGPGGHGGTGGFGGREITTGGCYFHPAWPAMAAMAAKAVSAVAAACMSSMASSTGRAVRSIRTPPWEAREVWPAAPASARPAPSAAPAAPAGRVRGGGIYDDAALTLMGGSITNNTADMGGGIDIKVVLTRSPTPPSARIRRPMAVPSISTADSRSTAV